ncbi:hypothetical protein R2K36_33405, partial [Pseudomonas aeruginosa]|uniref:hypothetical protein n=1 Tax=Pseudomonas aeruginosa TaxID=287 RepID=UPI00396F5179
RLRGEQRGADEGQQQAGEARFHGSGSGVGGNGSTDGLRQSGNKKPRMFPSGVFGDARES